MRTRTEQAIELMMGFAERTGLTAGRPHQRYLWTDAFAVCNFLGLAHVTGKPRFTELGLQLVNQVHHVLGRHRIDDREPAGSAGSSTNKEKPPTCGGLRIASRCPSAARRTRGRATQWDRDGQTSTTSRREARLDQVTHETRRRCQPGRASSPTRAPRFRHVPRPTPQADDWKLSVDWRARWSSIGQHDPLSRHRHAARGDGRRRGPPLGGAVPGASRRWRGEEHGDAGPPRPRRTARRRIPPGAARSSGVRAAGAGRADARGRPRGWPARAWSSRTCACPLVDVERAGSSGSRSDSPRSRRTRGAGRTAACARVWIGCPAATCRCAPRSRRSRCRRSIAGRVAGSSMRASTR